MKDLSALLSVATTHSLTSEPLASSPLVLIMQNANITKCSCVLKRRVYTFCIDILINSDMVLSKVSGMTRKAVHLVIQGGRFKVILLGQLKMPYGSEGGEA